MYFTLKLSDDKVIKFPLFRLCVWNIVNESACFVIVSSHVENLMRNCVPHTGKQSNGFALELIIPKNPKFSLKLNGLAFFLEQFQLDKINPFHYFPKL